LPKVTFSGGGIFAAPLIFSVCFAACSEEQRWSCTFVRIASLARLNW